MNEKTGKKNEKSKKNEKGKKNEKTGEKTWKKNEDGVEIVFGGFDEFDRGKEIQLHFTVSKEFKPSVLVTSAKRARVVHLTLRKNKAFAKKTKPAVFKLVQVGC